MGDSRGGVLSVVDLDAVLDELESQEEVKQNIPQVETEEQDLAAPSQGNLPPPSESSDIHPPATTVSVEAPLLVGLGDSETLSAGEEAPVASPSNPSDVGVEASSSPSSSSSTFESIYDNQPPSSEEADALPSVPPQPEVTDPDTSEGQEGAGNSADVPDDSVPPSTTGATPIPLESPPPYR